MTDLYTMILSRLVAVQNPERAAFTAGYHPTAARILGVSVPDLRPVVQWALGEARPLKREEVMRLASDLIGSGLHEGRQVAYELLERHKATRGQLSRAELEALGAGMDNWVSVDTFSVLLAGASLRRGLLTRADLLDWSGRPDRWWRRAALVTTTGWNQRSRGGRGNVADTLAVCLAQLADRDELVVKAMSWALRDCVVWDPEAVRAFLGEHEAALAARARREVRKKLETGRKNG